MFNLDGKTALVTGAARGIGFGIATAAAKRGANVVVIDLDEADAKAAAARLGPAAIGMEVDVTDAEALAVAMAEVVEQFGSLDLIVANAGVAPRGATVRAMDVEVFDRVLEVNLKGVTNTVRAGLPHVIASKGHFVLVSSIYAFMNGVGVAPYAMAKAGVEQLGRALRTELTPTGATCGVVYFGFVDTDMVRIGFDEDPAAKAAAALLPLPLRKRIQPSYAGEVVLRGVERRAARTITPRVWIPVSALRGIVNPVVDAVAPRLNKVSDVLKVLDLRSGEPQRLTAGTVDHVDDRPKTDSPMP